MIGGPCSSSVAVTKAVKPEISARTSTPCSVWCLMPVRHRAAKPVKFASLASPSLPERPRLGVLPDAVVQRVHRSRRFGALHRLAVHHDDRITQEAKRARCGRAEPLNECDGARHALGPG